MMVRYFVLLISIGRLGVDGTSSTRAEVMDSNTTEIMTVNSSDYCFVDNSTVRRYSDNVHLTVFYDYDDYLVATDGTEYFGIPNNVSHCNNDFCSPRLVIYSIQTTLNCIIVLLVMSNITLHLYFKRLRTEFGMLVIVFCSANLFSYFTAFIYNRYQFTHKVDESGTVCAVLVYMRVVFVLVYHTTVITIFFHFTYLMYNSYKMRSVGPDLNTKLIFKYITFIITVTTICAVLLIPYDMIVSRNAFTTTGGYCATEYKDKTKGSLLALFAVLLAVIVAQMLMFGLGLMLYFLINRNLCEFRSVDIRVCLLLLSTSGVGAMLFVMSSLCDTSKSMYIPFLLTSVGTLVQQLILLIISFKKVV